MSKKPPTPLQQLRNLCEILCEDALVDNKPLTKSEREEAERLRSRLLKLVDDYEARAEKETAEPDWVKRTGKKKGPSGSGQVM